jgi:hypothetical protein
MFFLSWWRGSSGRAPAQQLKGREFKAQYHQKFKCLFTVVWRTCFTIGLTGNRNFYFFLVTTLNALWSLWVLVRNQDIILLRIPYMWQDLSLLWFLSVTLCFSSLVIMCFSVTVFKFALEGFRWRSCMCTFMLFNRFGKFSTITSSENSFSVLFLENMVCNTTHTLVPWWCLTDVPGSVLITFFFLFLRSLRQWPC